MRTLDGHQREARMALLQAAKRAVAVVDGSLHRSFIDPNQEASPPYLNAIKQMEIFQ